MNLLLRRRDVSRIIEDDPWTLTFTRKGVGTADDSQFVTTGRVVPRSAMDTRGSSPATGEVPSSTEAWLALLDWDSEQPMARDVLTAVQTATSRSMSFIVVSVNPYAYKLEVFLQYAR